VRSLLLKRTLDLTGALAVLTVGAPLVVGVAALVWIDVGRPILFAQTRPGHRGRLFEMYKFRTMHDAVDRDGRTLPDDERLTRIGKFLRATSLDELPELWNVVRGEMSLVGPRPLLTRYLTRYSREQARRHDVMPGVTGWAQVNGRNSPDWNHKLSLDIWYVDNWTNWLDLQIVLRTFGSVLRRDGISHRGTATMPEFVVSEGV
jgi:sugar transferase EpsL